MKKTIIIIIAIVLITLLVGCQPELSRDSFEVKAIYTESSTYVFDRIENEETSEIIYEMEVLEDIITFSTIFNIEEGQYTSLSTVDKNTMKPIYTEKGNIFDIYPEKNWKITGTYGVLLEMTAITNEETESLNIGLPVFYLENESLIFTLGAVIEQEDLVLNIVFVDGGNILPYKASWLGISDITVPYGTYECFRVQLEYTGVVLGEKPRLDFWYTNDAQPILIKYAIRGMELQLSDIY